MRTLKTKTRLTGRTGLALLLALSITGCAQQEKAALVQTAQGAGLLLRIEDRGAVQEGIEIPTETRAIKPGERVEYVDGSGSFTRRATPVRQIVKMDDGGLSLNFRNTDILAVLRAVLGDVLGLSYSVDPQVQGDITMETSGAVSPEALRDILETVLRVKGFALVPLEGRYHVMPVTDAPKRLGAATSMPHPSQNLPGFGIRIVPLTFTQPSAMEKVLEPFATRGAVLKADDARNLIILAGTSQELAVLMQTIETFDVDAMAGMSFALFTLNYAQAKEIAEELESILADDQAPIMQNVRFVPIPRVNKLLAISPNPKTLRDVEGWVNRLDLGGTAPGRRIYVYHVQNGRALDIAQSLNQILGTQGASGGGGNYGSQANGSMNARIGSDANGPFSNARQDRRNRTQGSERDGYGDGLGQQGIRIVPSEENNSLMILASPSEFGVIEAALHQIDIPPRQVLIEATLAEVGLTDELRYGLQWHFESGSNQVSLGRSASPAPEFPGFSWAYSSASSASVVLNAIESITNVRVLSAPKLVVLNNQTATLQVGDEVPVPTASAVSTSNNGAPIVNTIQYRSTGVIMKVTPRINDGGLIMLDVEQEISDVVETSSSGIDAPTIQQRKITTTVAVQNGETIALGGLIRETHSQTTSGVPFLKDIPILGAAFRTTDNITRRTELIILLTPRIIRNTAETRQVMTYLRGEFRSLFAEPETTGPFDADLKEAAE